MMTIKSTLSGRSAVLFRGWFRSALAYLEDEKAEYNKSIKTVCKGMSTSHLDKEIMCIDGIITIIKKALKESVILNTSKYFEGDDRCVTVHTEEVHERVADVYHFVMYRALEKAMTIGDNEVAHSNGRFSEGVFNCRVRASQVSKIINQIEIQ